MSSQEVNDAVPPGIGELDEKPPVEDPGPPEVLIITGMSGGGRSHAASVFEDYGWFVVDNLPPMMLQPLVEMMARGTGGVRKLAAVLDVRSREFFSDIDAVLTSMSNAGIEHQILFLDASDDVLVRRYEQVRRPHPLQGDGPLLDGISQERQELASLRRSSDLLIDTSNLNVHDLRREISRLFVPKTENDLRITIMSFGFKYGLPMDSEFIADVRFIANPYWVSELRHLTGKDEQVRDYVMGQPDVEEFLQRYLHALEPVISSNLIERRHHMTIAIGCTGGKHRSVASTEYLANELRKSGLAVSVKHRDLGRE